VTRISLYRERPLGIVAGTIFVLVSVALVRIADSDAVFMRLVGLLMMVAGLALIFLRHYIEIDTGTRRLSRRFGVLYGFPIRRFSFDQVQHISLVEERRKSTSSKHGSSTRTVYVLRIKQSGDHFYELANMWQARLLAERICRELKIGLENHLLGGSSLRAADELDVTLAERWRRAGEHKEAPRVPPGSILVIEHGEDFSELSSPVEPFPRTIAGMVGAAVFSGFVALYQWTEFPFLLLLVFGGATLFFSIGLILQHSGRNRIRFTADFATFHRGRLSRQKIALARVEELLSNDQELVLMSDDSYLKIDKPRGDTDALLLRQFVERQLAQRQMQATTKV
jgi:hypothetical protein